MAELREDQVEIEEAFEESFPNGIQQYTGIHFGPVRERRILTIPKDCGDIDAYILEARRNMHNRLVASCNYAVNRALKEGRLRGVVERKI